MGLSNEILKKPAPETKSLEGLNGAGLGMALPEEPHIRMANHFVRKYGGLEAIGYEAESESPALSKSKEYRVADFAIKNRQDRDSEKYGQIVLAIEICHSGNYVEAHERILDIIENYDDPECFIFQYDTGRWEKILKDNIIKHTSRSKFLHKDIMTGSKTFYNEVMFDYNN